MMPPRRFSLEDFSLKNKTAVITGGNSGLGFAFAQALAAAGADVFIPSLICENEETRAELEGHGVRCAFMEIDLTEPGAPQKIVAQCVRTFGGLDILVNNAGICLQKPVLDFGRTDWDAMVRINLTAAFELAHEAAQVMVPQRSGKIINICSLFSYLGGLGSPAYAATKHALAGFTKAYCDELAPHNIQVNGIAPGYFATELTRQSRENPETSERILKHIPAQRWGDPEDLMGAVVFLASRASDYVNGHLLVVDGGYLVR